MNLFMASLFSISMLGALAAAQDLAAARPAAGTALGSKHESPLACDRLALTPQQRRRHFDELGPMLRSELKSIRELPDGYEFQFPAQSAAFRLVSEWVDGERLCCPFFDIDVRFEREHGALWLSLRGREGVKQFIHADFAKWFQK